MAAPTVYEGVGEDVQLDGFGQLFEGIKFWVAQRVPFRNRVLDDIKANGGEVVLLEKKADYLIADHFRNNCPAGSISYEFIEKSIQDGRLRDPEDHLAGPRAGESREAGAINRPTKGSRAAYTAEEDKILYKWVRDCQANGGHISGNEIYKQLEAQVCPLTNTLPHEKTDRTKHPRHTWQSWRDRYLKQLRGRPPSAFNIPDNAPPTPPSETLPGQSAATEPAAAAERRQGVQKPPRAKTGTAPRAQQRPSTEYSLKQLEATFTSQDWEELYAFVDDIESTSDDAEKYETAWKGWAEMQDNQTPEQWQQYYEKVVRPQWLRDPGSKRNQIKLKVEKRHERELAESSQAGPAETEPDDPTTQSMEPEVPTKGRRNEMRKPEPDPKQMSSSTVQHESPKYIKALFPNLLKREREEETAETEVDEAQQDRPVKRRKSASPAVEENIEQGLTGTEHKPEEISSTESQTTTSQSEILATQINEQFMRDTQQAQDIQDKGSEVDVEEVEDELESIESDDLPKPTGLHSPNRPSDDDESDLPSNTPTPRASRQAHIDPETQTILASTSQGFKLSRLPKPPVFSQGSQHNVEHRNSSVAPHPSSDVSTTQSLEDFRRSLNDEETQPSYPSLRTLPFPISSSPAPSDTSSAGSCDADMPLAAEEVPEFFNEKMEEGYPQDFIHAALKRTRLRPELAEIVLDAWSRGEPLPNQRGIWSKEDDEAVESGDGVALARLERKHTLDGWGGVTERLIFLEGYRRR